MIETKNENWGRVGLLVLVAVGVWLYNAGLLQQDSMEDTPPNMDRGGEGSAAIDVHERTRILRRIKPAEALALSWDPFTRQPLGAEPEPEPQNVAPVETKVAAPPPPAFRLEFIGFVEGERRQVYILRSSEGLEFVALNDVIGPWRLTARRDDVLVFEDSNGHSEELSVRLP